MMRCSEYASERSAAGWRWLLKGGTSGQRARVMRVVNEEVVQDRVPELNTVELVPFPFPGFRLRRGSATCAGHAATPPLVVQGAGHG